jgi:hypothetical protein
MSSGLFPNTHGPAGRRSRVARGRPATARAVCLAGLVCLVANCSTASLSPHAAPAAAERVVSASDFGGAVTVKVGDVLVVRRPMNAAEWQVAYDTTLLAFQGTPETLARPGDNGWTFRVLRAGETTLTVTPVMRSGPNPPRFSVGIHIDA